eukprot:Nitzschia sp. Nitz4//scaffold56_size114212//82197//84424//NITZ4_003961-RA/size114212-snap-gene-0.174-mRNA-1//1//CDS//3329554739//4861//frame0
MALLSSMFSRRVSAALVQRSALHRSGLSQVQLQLQVATASSAMSIPSNHATMQPPFLTAANVQRRMFSTDVQEPPSLDLSDKSTAQLKEMIMKFARVKQPLQAQAVLEHLVNQTGEDAMSEDDLSVVRTSIVDSWIQFQRAQLASLDKSALEASSSRPLDLVCQAAESVEQLVDSMSNTSPHHTLIVLTAWANACEAAHKSNDTSSTMIRGVPQRIQHILDSQSAPTTEMVNQVVKAWAYSGEHLRGTMAEQIFQKHLSRTLPTPGTPQAGLSPTGDSFRHIIRAWCWSKERRCAFTATGHFMRMMRMLEMGKSEMEPTLDDYHVVFHAWTTAEDKNAPSKVQNVLEIVDNAYRRGLTEVRPDTECYADALATMSRRVNVPEVGALVDATLSEMKLQRMMIPTTECYGAAILAWLHVATARECEDRERAVQRTYDLLQEMIKAFHRTTTVSVRPATEHYNLALEALTVSKSAKAATLASTLLTDLEESKENSPDATSYKLTLNSIQNSRKSNKFEQGVEVFGKFKSRAKELLEKGSSDAVIDAFSAYILVCAHSGFKDEPTRTKTMTNALKVLEDMRELGLSPNSSTYAALVEACDNLIADGKDRQRVLENIFQRACDDGYVNQTVLESFKMAASAYLYTKLVVAPSQQLEYMKVVPESWTRNVKGFLVNSRGGRKVLPLTIEGKFTFTKAAAEYKMRKLRRKHNKQLLQGGRMK